MDASLEPPSLSYPQLFSFQVSYTSQSDYRNTIIPEGSKKGEWRYGILEVDFPMETFFLQDRDRIFLSQTFSSFIKHAEDNSSDDCSLSLIFNLDQWEVAAQNVAEKVCLQHILECVTKKMTIDDVVQSGREKGIVGLDKNIIKHGRVQRKAINQKRLDDRYLVLCPGKLFVFKTVDVKGKHVRYVTSLFGATVRILSEECEFQILAPGSKTVTLIPESQEDLSFWIDALAISIGYTKQVANVSETEMKGQEKRSEMQLTKECMIQRKKALIDQCIALPLPRLSQQPHATEEITSSIVDSRPALASLKSLARSQGKKDGAECLQEARLQRPFRKDHKESRDIRESCVGKSSSNRPSRAMVYLENALDEMEVIVGNIRTTVGHFNMFEKQGSTKGDPSPLRSSWDSNWNKKELHIQKGKRSHLETKWGERDSYVSSSKGLRAEEVPKLTAWKKPVSQSNTDGHLQRATNSRIRESETSRLRHSIDGLTNFGRNRTLAGVPKYPMPQQDQSLGRVAYSGRSPPSGMPVTTSARMPSKIQLSPASENLLKRYSGQVSEAEISSLSQSLQRAPDSGAHFRNTNIREQNVNKKSPVQQQRIMENCFIPCIVTPSSSSGGDEEEEDIKEDGEENENHSVSRYVPTNLSYCKDSAMRDGLSGRQYVHDVNLGQHSPSKSISTCINFPKDLASLDQTSATIDAAATTKQENFPSGQHCQSWQDFICTPKGQQTLECSPSNRIYSICDQYSGVKPNVSGVPKKPVTPKFREESRNNPVLASGLKVGDQGTLQDPIYDPDFTEPEIINRRQRRLENYQGFHGCANVQKAVDSAGLQNRFLSMHLPSSQEAKGTHDRSNLYRNQFPSNAYGNEKNSTDFSGYGNQNFSSLYREHQTNSTATQMASPGVSASVERVQPMKVDHGLPHLNELPELVNRISKITAAFDSRDQQGHDTTHGGVSGAAAYDMQVAGQDSAADPYASQNGYLLLESVLARGLRQSIPNDPHSLNNVEGHVT